MELTREQGHFTDITSEQRQQIFRDHARSVAERENRNSYPPRDGIDCKICKNRGFIAVAEDTEVVYRECGCRTARASIARLKASGLEKLVERSTFDRYEVTSSWQRHIKDTALEYVRNGGDAWFYIGGAVGSGKSHICVAISAELIKQGNRLRYMAWQDEAVRLKAIKTEAEEYADAISQLKTVDVLCIDDFMKIPRSGQREPTTGDLNLAAEIIYSRYNAGLKTIISSEWTVDDVMMFDPGTGSRILEKAKEFEISVAPDASRNYRMHLRAV